MSGRLHAELYDSMVEYWLEEFQRQAGDYTSRLATVRKGLVEMGSEAVPLFSRPSREEMLMVLLLEATPRGMGVARVHPELSFFGLLSLIGTGTEDHAEQVHKDYGVRLLNFLRAHEGEGNEVEWHGHTLGDLRQVAGGDFESDSPEEVGIEFLARELGIRVVKLSWSDELGNTGFRTDVYGTEGNWACSVGGRGRRRGGTGTRLSGQEEIWKPRWRATPAALSARYWRRVGGTPL